MMQGLDGVWLEGASPEDFCGAASLQCGNQRILCRQRSHLSRPPVPHHKLPAAVWAHELRLHLGWKQ